MKKIILPVIALVVAVGCAFGADYLFYIAGDHTKTEVTGTAVFTDGREVLAASGCEIIDGEIYITDGDPNFALAAPEEKVSVVRMDFPFPLAQNTSVQLYYALPGEGFIEENSFHVVIPSGAQEYRIRIPSAVYAYFRLDPGRNMVLQGITAGNETLVKYVYHPHTGRIILLGAEVFVLFLIVCFIILNRRGERKGSSGRVRGKPAGTIVLCNLFLALTVVVFQPMAFVHAWVKGFAPGNALWVCAAVAAGAAAVLSCLMMLLPPRAGIGAAGLSLGAGAAFLLQSLLFNGNRVFRMDTSFPMEMMNIILWFGIILIAAVMAAACAEGRQTATVKKVLCVAAAVLIAVQAMDWTILATVEEGDPLPKGYSPEAEYEGGSTFGELMELSGNTGLPFYLK